MFVLRRWEVTIYRVKDVPVCDPELEEIRKRFWTYDSASNYAYWYTGNMHFFYTATIMDRKTGEVKHTKYVK